MMNNPSKVGKSREIVNEYWSNSTTDLSISYLSLTKICDIEWTYPGKVSVHQVTKFLNLSRT